MAMIYVNVTCECGETTHDVPLKDAAMDGFYSTCSDACRSILDTRISWSEEYGYDYLMRSFV